MLINKSGLACQQAGFSLIEIIIAIAIFSIIITGGLTGFIPILNQNRQSNEIIQANRLAEEGLEAVRSIRNRDFSLLSAGNKGIGISSNLWNFNGTSDTTGKFTRQIYITAANRDAGGTLVPTGGNTDPDTWLIKSLVTWNYSIGETKQFFLETVLTNWRKPIPVVIDYDAVIVYSDNTSFPRWRTYSTVNNTFGTETTMPAITGSPRNFVLKASPNNNELIAGTVSSAGVLYVYCFNGTNWTQDWSVTVGGTADTRRFDIAYEKTSGKAVVLYSTNTTNEMAFRTKSGSATCGSANWNSAISYNPLRTSGIVQWVKLAPDQRSSSNIMATIWADSASDLSAAIWNGTTFANEPSSVTESSLEVVSTSQDVDDFDLAYESLSGDLLVVWANSAGNNGTNGARYRVCTGGTTTCAWGAVTIPPTFKDDSTNLDLASDPVSNDIVFASIGDAGSDLQIGYWNGSTWTNRANVDTSAGTPLAGTKLVASGFLENGATSRYVVAYMDSTGTSISWYVASKNGNPSKQKDFTPNSPIGNPKKWIELRPDLINQNTIMAIISDTNSDLFAKKLSMDASANFTWTEADSGSALELNLAQPIVKPFGFVYKKQ